MKVLKFGGTSLGTADRMKGVYRIIKRDNTKKIVVLSAVSGTTNTLAALANPETESKEAILADLYASYQVYVKELYHSEQYAKEGMAVVDHYFSTIRHTLEGKAEQDLYKELVIKGELISTNLFIKYLEEQNEKSTLLNAVDFMHLNEEGEPDLEKISRALENLLPAYSDREILITQGFICRNAKGKIDNLKRGGSDYSATLIAAAIRAEEVQIWTDIDGMHNNDPRIVENTFPIAQLSFEEAGELAYFGAKILHPSCIIPARQRNVAVRIKNTLDPDARGTLITGEKNPDTIKAIAVKDQITAIKIKSSRMINAYGFLRKVFEVFEKYKTPIDMITTSEIAVSVTIDDSSSLTEIIEEISQYGTVEVDKNQSIICIVGDFVAERKGVGTGIFSALHSIPVRMISYGGSKNNISLLIDTDYKKEALTSLNSHLFGL